MMNTITVARSITTRSSSGVTIGERIPSQRVMITMTSRRFGNTTTSMIGSKVANIKTCQNSSIRSLFRANREDRTLYISSNMNVLYRPQNKQHRALLSSSTSSNSSNNKNVEENPFMRRTNDMGEDDLPPITLDNTVRMKNMALATVLVAGCFGIAYYSMHAVGQAGTGTASDSSTDGDPLAVLKAEAALAQEKYDKEQQETASTADMLEKFQKGEYDPDHVSDEELDDLIDPKKKRPWYKFW